MKSGQKVAKWTLLSPLGAGGNGEVWKVRDENGNEGALKLLRSKFNKPEDSRYRRFCSEIEALKLLGTRKDILPLIEVFLPETPSEKELPWFVMPVAIPMELALGKSPSLEAVVKAIASIAETLADLHAREIFHRDIKPGNLYKYGDDWAVGDFGLAEYPNRVEITAEHEVVGPRFFLANEMVLDAKNARGGPADVNSLAKTLWVLATGWKYPPPGHQLFSYKPYTIHAIRNEPRAFHLDRLIERSTDSDPAKRPFMTEFANELRSWLNPKTPTDMSHDFSDVASRMSDISQPAIRESEQKAAFIEQVQELRPPLQKWAENTNQALTKQLSSTFSITVTDQVSFIFELFSLSLPAAGTQVWADGIEFHLQSLSGHPSYLVMGFTMHLYEDGTLHMWAAHTILPMKCYGAKGEVVWRLRKVVQVGSSEAQNAISEIIDGLDKNLRPAIERFEAVIRTSVSNPFRGVIRTVLDS